MENNTLQCPACGSSDLRRAKLRIADALQVIRLWYPVRCRNCRVRINRKISEAIQLDPFYHYRELGDEPQSFLVTHPGSPAATIGAEQS